jgi:histidinol-phosphatase
MNRFVATAIDAAQAAAEAIMKRYRGELGLELKSDQTPVTLADREAEQVIRGILRKAFPNHGIHGEEYGVDRPGAEFLWLVDPIDGTKSFVRGTGMFSVQIALRREERIIAGVSLAPSNGELAWAATEEGAWLDGERLRVSEVETLEEAHLSVGNLSSLAASERWADLGEVVTRVNRLRGYGDYYHYHRLAAGQLDAVVESDVNILDIAALSLLVSEAGGVFTDLAGKPVDLDTRSVLAATPALHQELLERLRWEG